jgi:hypothetical protein
MAIAWAVVAVVSDGSRTHTVDGCLVGGWLVVRVDGWFLNSYTRNTQDSAVDSTPHHPLPFLSQPDLLYIGERRRRHGRGCRQRDYTTVATSGKAVFLLKTNLLDLCEI